MQIIKTRLSMIRNRIERTDDPVAVFVRQGEILAAELGSHNYGSLLRSAGSELVGIYDSRSELQWMIDDVAEILTAQS